jgi:transcriptional regulator with XRE-family HTH domain
MRVSGIALVDDLFSEAVETDFSTVGRVFRRARERRGWSVREVARRTGLGNTYLSQIERAVIRKPDPSTMWTLAELYNLNFERLLEWSGQDGDDRLLRDALRTLMELSPEQRTMVLNFMRSLEPQADPTIVDAEAIG